MQKYEKVPLPEIDWQRYDEYAKVLNPPYPNHRYWICPGCGGWTGVQKNKCRSCPRKRVLLQEGNGPRGGELFGWYMRIDWK